MIRRAALTLLAALALAAGCGSGSLDDVAFERVEALPGFDLKVPSGKPLRERRGPAAGELMFKKGGAVMAVSWQAGRHAQADLPTVARATMDALGVATGGTGGDEVPLELAAPDYGLELVSPTDKRVYLVFTTIQCAHANVTVSLTSMASTDRAKALAFHQRFRSTLRCRQDGPPLGLGTALPDFVLDDATGYLPGSDPPSYYATTGERWHVTPGVTSEKSALDKPEVVKRMFGSLGLPVVSHERLPYTGAADWMVLRLEVEVEGDQGYVMMGMLTCGPDRSYTVVYMHLTRFGEPPEVAAVERVRCPAAPVDGTSLPTVQQRFGAACDGGDGQACVLLAGLVDEEPALLKDVDRAAVQAKACKAGVSEACD